MYSHGNQIAGNRFIGDVTGVFVMYSRDVEIRGNVFADSRRRRGHGARPQGVGQPARARESVRCTTRSASTSIRVPLWPDDRNRFEANVFRLNGIAVSFLGRASGNEFLGNGFRDSQVQVQVDGRGDARQAVWRSNDFDDYAGYDLDGDGTGDVPYELRSLASDLGRPRPRRWRSFAARRPSRSSRRSGASCRSSRPACVLSDPEPRMTRVAWEGPRAD